MITRTRARSGNRLTAITMALAFLVGALAAAPSTVDAATKSDNETKYEVTQYFGMAYSTQTCGGNDGKRIDWTSARWYRKYTNRTVRAHHIVGATLASECPHLGGTRNTSPWINTTFWAGFGDHPSSSANWTPSYTWYAHPNEFMFTNDGTYGGRLESKVYRNNSYQGLLCGTIAMSGSHSPCSSNF